MSLDMIMLFIYLLTPVPKLSISIVHGRKSVCHRSIKLSETVIFTGLGIHLIHKYFCLLSKAPVNCSFLCRDQ